MDKKSPKGYILNPATGRYVKRTGVIGKKVLALQSVSPFIPKKAKSYKTKSNTPKSSISDIERLSPIGFAQNVIDESEKYLAHNQQAREILTEYTKGNFEDQDFFVIVQNYLREGFSKKVQSNIESGFNSSRFLRHRDEADIKAAISQLDAALLGAPRQEKPSRLLHATLANKIGKSQLFPEPARPGMIITRKTYTSTTITEEVTSEYANTTDLEISARDVSNLSPLKPIRTGTAPSGAAYLTLSIGCCLAVINIPAGFPILYIDSISDSDGEDEVLLPRNIQLRLIERKTIREGPTFPKMVWFWELVGINYDD